MFRPHSGLSARQIIMIERALIQFIFWLAFLLLVSFLLERIWASIFSGRNYQLLVFPGVLVHEFSHALGCLVSGAKIIEISLFSSKGSYVKHEKPRVPLLGSFIISFAPIAGGIAFLWGIAGLLNFILPLLESSSLFERVRGLVHFTVANWDRWMFWLFVYITISVVICLVPSRQDLKNSAVSTFVILLGAFLVSYLGVFDLEPFLSYISGILAVGAFFGLFALAFSAPAYLLKKLI